MRNLTLTRMTMNNCKKMGEKMKEKLKRRYVIPCTLLFLLAITTCSACSMSPVTNDRIDKINDEIDKIVEQALELRTVAVEYTAKIDKIVKSPAVSVKRTNYSVIITYKNGVNFSDNYSYNSNDCSYSVNVCNTNRVLSEKQMKQIIKEILYSQIPESDCYEYAKEFCDAYNDKSFCEDEFTRNDVDYCVTMHLTDTKESETVTITIK